MKGKWNDRKDRGRWMNRVHRRDMEVGMHRIHRRDVARGMHRIHRREVVRGMHRIHRRVVAIGMLRILRRLASIRISDTTRLVSAAHAVLFLQRILDHTQHHTEADSVHTRTALIA